MILINIRRRVALIASLSVMPCAVAMAQQEGTPPAPPTPAPVITSVIPASAADTVEIIITARATDSVRAEKDKLLGERRDAETRWAGLADQEKKLESVVSELRNAIDAANAKEKLAKKDKRDSDRMAAAVEKRQLNRSLDLVAARRSLRQAQIEEARIHRDFLDASVRAADAELAIAERRDQVVPNDPAQRTAFQELTNRWLQALRTRAARAYDLEDRRFKVVESQMSLLKRQRD